MCARFSKEERKIRIVVVVQDSLTFLSHFLRSFSHLETKTQLLRWIVDRVHRAQADVAVAESSQTIVVLPNQGGRLDREPRELKIGMEMKGGMLQEKKP